MKRSRRTTRTYYASILKLRVRSAKKIQNEEDNESSISSDNSSEYIDNVEGVSYDNISKYINNTESATLTESVSYDNISEYIDNTESVALTESVSYDNILEHINNTESVALTIEEELNAESSNSCILPGILINEVN